MSLSAKTITRSSFEKLDAAERATKMRQGFTLIDDRPDPKAIKRYQPRPGEKVITRQEFEMLSPVDRMSKVKDGFKVVD